MAIELNDVKSGYSTPLISANFQRLEDELNNNVLRRDGLAPGEANQMNVPLDMNSNPILNAATDPDNPDSMLTMAAGDSRYVNLAGDTMQGSLDMGTNPVLNAVTDPEDPRSLVTREFGDERYVDKALWDEGYVVLAQYLPTAGIVIEKYNQTLQDTSGELWRLNTSIPLPYTTTGEGMPEEGAFVTVSDGALRGELADPAEGGGLVSVTTSTGEQTLAEALDSRMNNWPILYHERTVTEDFVIPDGSNAASFGPDLIVEEGGSITVGEGAEYTLISFKGLQDTPESGDSAGLTIGTQEQHDNPAQESALVQLDRLSASDGFLFQNMPQAIDSPIVESGSNANGHWVRFAEGTQICTATSLGPVNVTSSNGQGFESGNQSWTYPAAFAEEPVISAEADNLNIWGVSTDAGLTSVNIRGSGFVSRTGVTLKATAIGRWKAETVAGTPPANLNSVTQSVSSLVNNGPLGQYIILNWAGTSNVTINSFASGTVPIGVPFYIEVPRTIADSGGPSGHGTGVIGNYVQFTHGNNIVCAANENLSYRATPNANDRAGDNAALFEVLQFVKTSPTTFKLTKLPDSRTGYTHGDPQTVPGTSSRTGFAWERRADGTCHLSNGTVAIPANDVGGSEPRFRFDLFWPFRFEQHYGNHRSVQLGISTKDTSVYWTDLSLPRNSSTTDESMRVTVYVAPNQQSSVSSGDTVNVSIIATGNWRLPSNQW